MQAIIVEELRRYTAEPCEKTAIFISNQERGEDQ